MLVNTHHRGRQGSAVVFSTCRRRKEQECFDMHVVFTLVHFSLIPFLDSVDNDTYNILNRKCT